jgi:hypothetical protein
MFCSLWSVLVTYSCVSFFRISLIVFLFSSLLVQLEIPKQLFDPNVFNSWMVLFINLLERPVPVEGQPIDPEIRKSWGWWKVKKWTIHILNRLYTRSVFNRHAANFILVSHCTLIYNLMYTDSVIWSFRNQRVKHLLKCFIRPMQGKYWHVTCSCWMQFVLVTTCRIGLSILFFSMSLTGLSWWQRYLFCAQSGLLWC